MMEFHLHVMVVVVSSNSDDTTMVHSLLDLVDISTFYKKQNKRILYEIDSWEILNLLLKQQ